jgi:hypothetical protein
MREMLPVIQFLQEIYRFRFTGKKWNGDMLKRISARFNNQYSYYPGSDNLGDAIEKEFDAIDDVSYHEKHMARGYFAEDYQYAYAAVLRHMEQARKSALEDDFSEEQEENLRKAGEALLRAKKDVLRIMKYCPGPSIVTKYASYQQILEGLAGAYEDLHLLWEFPRSYNQIHSLHREYRAAVIKNDYEKAAGLQRRIEEIVAGNDLEESKQ